MNSKIVLLTLVFFQANVGFAKSIDVTTVYSPMGGSYLVYTISDEKPKELSDAQKLNKNIHYAQLATKTMTDVLDQVNAIDKPSYSKLKTGVLLSYPAGLRNVKEVANYFLTIAGYSLVIPSENPQETGEILLRKPSDLANTGKISTVEKALLLVSGTDTRLLVDHKSKYVTLVKAVKND